jgi:hypothetical protein
VIAIAGDFGHGSGFFAGSAAVVFTFFGVAFAGRMGAFLSFCGHLGVASVG